MGNHIDDPKRSPIILQVRSNLLPPLRVENQYGPLSLDLNGRLRVLLSAIEDGILPADALAAPLSLPVDAFLQGYNGASWDRIQTVNPQSTVLSLPTNGAVISASVLFAQASGFPSLAGPLAAGNGADGQSFPSGLIADSLNYAYTGTVNDRVRVPNLARTATATVAGSTAIWAPATGNKFRLMRYKIDIPTDALQAVAGDIDIQFFDGATAMPIAETVYVPSALVAGTAGSWTSGWVDLGQGIASAAANNVLAINLSAALTASKVRVIVAGVEGTTP